MKKTIIPFICLVTVFMGCNQQKKDPNTKTQNLKKMVSQRVDEGKIEEAIRLVDEVIAIEGENRDNLGRKYVLLMKSERYEEALESALQRDEIAREKSPWDSIRIAEAHLKLEHPQKALQYLTQAVKERKFININHLRGETYGVFQGNEEFLSLLDIIRENIGIGEPARNFTVPLLNGERFSLSAEKGAVVMALFWASWCPDCVEEIPLIREIYRQYHDQGLQIIGISLDQDEKQFKTFLKEQQIPWRNSFSGEGWNDPTAQIYNVSSIPSIWLVDHRGTLRYFDVHGKDLKKAVDSLMNQPGY